LTDQPAEHITRSGNASGKVRSPLTETLIRKSQYGDHSDQAHYNNTLAETEPEDTSFGALVRNWAQEEKAGHKKSTDVIENLLIDKLDESNITEDHKTKLYEYYMNKKDALVNGTDEAGAKDAESKRGGKGQNVDPKDSKDSGKGTEKTPNDSSDDEPKPNDPDQGPDETPEEDPQFGPTGLPINFDTIKDLLAPQRDAYADVSARRRRVTWFSRKNKSKQLENAQKAYDKSINDIVDVAWGQLYPVASEDNPDAAEGNVELKNYILFRTLLNEVPATQVTIYNRRSEIGKDGKLSGFYDWWARQGGADSRFKGKIQKAAVMAGIGLGTGLALGAIVGTAGLGLVGGVATGGVASGIARGLARAKMDKGGQDTVALGQLEYQSDKATANLRDKYFATNRLTGRRVHLTPNSATSEVTGATNDEVKRNSKRMLGSAAVGAIVGLVGGELGHLAHDAIGSAGHSANHTAAPKAITTPVEHATKAPVAAHHAAVAATHHKDVHKEPSQKHTAAKNGKDFYVEPGSGEINEVREYAAANGHKISAERATRIYGHLHQKFGRKIIDLAGKGPNTYLKGSDVRLTHPGMAHWYPGVEADINNELSKS
jgi:hypothetical protein